MPAWHVLERISPRRFRDAAFIVVASTKEHALRMACFTPDRDETDIRLLPAKH